MRSVRVFIIIIFILVFVSLVCRAQEDVQAELGDISGNVDVAQSYFQNGKITELRNEMWDNVDPQIQMTTNYIENNIETLTTVGIYNLDELNISQGDIKRGMDLFDKAKVDVDYSINDMNFQKKISETRDVITELKEISILIPEIDVNYEYKKTPFLLDEKSLDVFSMNVKNVDSYSKIKSMNITDINNKIGIIYNEVTYTYKIDEQNNTLVVKSINKDIRAYEPINNIEIYEIFPDNINLSDVIFRSLHAPDLDKNSILLYKGALMENITIPLTFTIKSNETIGEISQTVFVLLENRSTQEIVEENNNITKKSEEPVKFGNIEIVEKINYVPYIALGVLVIILLLLILANLTTKNKLAKDLEKYRRKINTLKENV